VIILGIVIVLACVTTAVALVSACGAYFSRLTKGKISYNLIVIFVCVFSAIVSNIGLSAIIAIAAPILSIVYPVAVVKIFLSLISPRARNYNMHRFAALGALIVSVIETGNAYGAYWWHMDFIAKLPLSQFGFGWVLPAVVLGVVGAAIKRPPVNTKLVQP
jgi:LIVCS family branched-chain amino acid:cation transporter